MAIAALSNFTVPLASDQSAGSQGMLMPKLKYRFRVTFENFGKSGSTTELTKQVQDCARPSVKFANQVIEIYNSKINYAGKPTWDPLAVKIRDDVTGAVTTLVGEQNQRQFDFFEQSSAASAGDYKFTMRIEMLDGGNGTSTPNVLETWVVYGCYLVSTNYQGLDYKAQEAVVLDLSIQYDNAVQTTGGALGVSPAVMTPGANTSNNVMGS
jgi:hypothetical protein